MELVKVGWGLQMRKVPFHMQVGWGFALQNLPVGMQVGLAFVLWHVPPYGCTLHMPLYGGTS